MRKWRPFVAAAMVILALPVLGAALAAAIIDPNDYKPQIAAVALAATGRELTMGGPLRVGLSLWPTIEISDVKLANLPGGSRPDMARVEKIEARLSLLGLLRGRVEVSTLTLVGPNILLEPVHGKPNWIFRQQAHPGPAQSGPSGITFSPTIRDFRVQNGMVTSKMPARTNVLGIRALRLRQQTDGGPIELAATLVYGDYRPFTLAASAQPTGGPGDPWNAQLEFAAFDATASAKGRVSISGDYDLHLDATLPALEKLNAVVPDIRLPALHQATLSTHLSNGPVRGDLPVIGATQLHIGGADLGNIVPGLKLGAVDVTLRDAGGLASITGLGFFAGQTLNFGGTFGVPEHPDGRVTLPVDLGVKTLRAANAAETGDLSLKGQLTLNTVSFDGLDATVAMRAPALADLRPLTTQMLPALTGVAMDGQLLVSADTSSWKFTGAKVSSREGDLAGDVAVGIGQTVALTGKVRSAKLDLSGVLTAFGIGSHSRGEPAQKPSGPLISDAPLPWQMLRGPAIDLTVDVGTMLFQGQALHDLQAAMTLRRGRLSIEPLTVALPAGPLKASLVADASAAVAPLSVTLHAPGIPLALISHYAGLPDGAAGALGIDAQLQSAGRSLHEIAASLKGPLKAKMIGGKLSNAALVELASASLQALGIDVPAGGETEIHCFGLVGAFDNGVGRFGTIAVSSTYLEVAGSGQLDLRTETAALKLHPMAQITGSPVSVPVVVEGPLRSLQGRLDASGLDQVGLLIDGLFGGDKSNTCSDAGLVEQRSDKP